jgi:predicted DNA-binding transcriptional regulator YafY
MASVGKIRRLLQILEYLQSGRKYHSGQLSEFLGVSKRTIFRDLKVLQDSGVQLLYDEVELGYWVPPTTFLPPTDLTINETLALLVLGEKLGQSENGIPFQKAARDAALKLLSNLPDSIRGMLSDVSNHLQIALEPRHPLDNANEHYDRVLEAIESRQKIRLQYESLHEGKPISTLVSPYEMVFQKRSWYVVGRSSLHRDIRTFHVGRITASSLTSDEYEIPPRFTLKRYFGNAWRMIRELPEVEVIVRFRPLVARNVAEVLWHPTQKMVWNADGSLNFHARVEGIREISWWILGYGDQAEVLAPPALRELIVAHVQRMAAVYQSSAAPPPKGAVTKRAVKKSTKRRSADPEKPKS